MTDYDFSKLNDKEFEALSVDLLSKLLGRQVERFKPGKDSGVDGRFFSIAAKEGIIQCKHWIKSGIDALIRHLKNQEAQKLDSLKPCRYIFTTSLPLSRKNKSDIQTALAPWIKTPSDILGQEDLNTLISQHPEIENRHYKLWLSSSSILARLNSIPIKGRSDFKISEAQSFASKYVPTAAHNEALTKLASLNVVILTGEPGIGKSTLAEQIALQYALQGFEICCIQDNISEAESFYMKDAPQLFYFDDFLGRNHLLALTRHEDSHVVGFIKRIRRDASKKFILTSRTTILNQGKQLSDLFKIENIDRNEYELTINQLSLLDKGKILYNHIWNNDLDDTYIDVIYENSRYVEISQHRNYSPRLISFLTDQYKINNIAPESYWSHILRLLNDPSDIWANVYDHQLSNAARIIVRLVVANGKDVGETTLKQAFARYTNCLPPSFGQLDDYNLAIRLTVGSVLNRTLSSENKEAKFTLFNPSIGDFVFNRVKENPGEIVSCLAALQTTDSLFNLRSISWSKLLSQKNINAITSGLATQLLANAEIEFKYQLELATICASLGNLTTKASLNLENFVKKTLLIEENFYSPEDQADLLHFAVESTFIDPKSNLFKTRLSNLIKHAETPMDFESISKILSHITPDEISLSDELTTRYVDCFRNNLETYISEDGVLDDFCTMDEVDAAKDHLFQYVTECINKLHIQIPSSSINFIINDYDVYDRVYNNQFSSSNSYDNPSGLSGRTNSDEVAALHDLFDRS